MIEDLSELEMFSVQDPLESKKRELKNAIEMVYVCCELLDIDMLFYKGYLYIFPEECDVGFSEEIEKAIDYIVKYCNETDSMLWLTIDFFYISRHVTDFDN